MQLITPPSSHLPQERDQEVRRLCSSACDNRERAEALAAEVAKLRRAASEAADRVEAYGNRMGNLEEELKAAVMVCNWT